MCSLHFDALTLTITKYIILCLFCILLSSDNYCGLLNFEITITAQVFKSHLFQLIVPVIVVSILTFLKVTLHVDPLCPR